jgi:type IV pilus assembly protein PilE
MKTMRIHQGGVTLIELVVVVVIFAILAAIAIPSYVSSIQKSRRTDAKTALTASAQAMERWFAQNNTYTGIAVGSGGVYAVSENGYYTIALSNTSVTTYTLTATPAGSQAGDPCGAFTLDQADNRGAATTGCW